MEKHKDAYGTCPRCKHVGWHPYKGKAVIFGNDNEKHKVSLYKCPKCGKKFGFDLGGDIPKLKKEEEKDDIEKLLEQLWGDVAEDDSYEVTPDQVQRMFDELGVMLATIDSGNLNAGNAATILISIKRINTILAEITGSGSDS